jgi:hypothetical protein
MIGGSIGSFELLKKKLNLYFTDGTLMTSLDGMVTRIFSSAPSKSKFKSTFLVLGGFLGRSMFIGGGLVCEIAGPVERGWFIISCLVYTWNYFFFNFSLDSWSRLFITSILAFLDASFMHS